MANIHHPTFGIHMSHEHSSDSFYLGDDEAIWNWVLDSAEQGVLIPSKEDDLSYLDGNVICVYPEPEYVEPVHDLILFSLPDGYYYWNGYLFDPSKGFPIGLSDLADARRTVTVTANAVIDDKAYIATMGLEEVTPKEFYNADLPFDRIITAKG